MFWSTEQFYDKLMQELVKTGKFSKIYKQSDVKFWFNWIRFGADLYWLSCTTICFFAALIYNALISYWWTDSLEKLKCYPEKFSTVTKKKATKNCQQFFFSSTLINWKTLTNLIKFIILRRPQNFAKSSPYFWLYVL